MFYVFLVDVSVEGQLAISAFAQDERETIFEGFNAKIVSLVDAMTDEKIGVIFVDFEPIYIVIMGNDSFTIRSYGDNINFTSDGTHLIRVGKNEPFSLDCHKTNILVPTNPLEAETVIEALVKGEEIILRYYVGDRYEQVDRKLQNITLGFVYYKAAKLFGWKDFGVSSELPPVKLSIDAPTDPDSKGYMCINVQGNPDLKLIKHKGGEYSSIWVGGNLGFGLRDNVEWVCLGDYYALFSKWHLIIRDSNGIIVFNEVLRGNYFPLTNTGGEWPEGETAAKKAWKSAPLGTIEISLSGEGKRVLLYGFRELWKWGVDNLNFPSVEPIPSPQVFLSNSQWDLGLISQGDLPTFAFTIENKGELNLVINKIDASEYVQYDVEIPLNILPGEKQEVIFTYDSRQHDLGEVLESIRIYCNDPRKNAFSLRIKGYIKEKSTPTESISPVGTETTYFLKGSLHCPDTSGYPCDSCGPPPDYKNYFKGFNVLTTNEDCYVKLIYNNGDYIGNQNNCEVTVKGEKWLGLEDSSGTLLVEKINEGNFEFIPTNDFVESTMSFPQDGYQYEFADEGREFWLYLSRDRVAAFQAVPWQDLSVEIKNKETNKAFTYQFDKGIFPRAYAWSGGVANYGQCVWWAAKRWAEEVDSQNLFPFYPSSPQVANVRKIESDYQPERFDILIDYIPGGQPGHYGFVEKVDEDLVHITQFNFIKPGEVYNHISRFWNGNPKTLYYSNNPSDLYYFKYYYRK